MGQVTVTLNGKKVVTDSNKTILDLARENGISIPTLCHDSRLEPYGSCRVCLVKVEGARTYLPSCSTKVTDGMVIDTESEDVKNARKMSLSLLISDHYGDCVSPCSQKCPANIDIQGYIALIAAKKYQEAVKLIKEKLPMPLAIGRICPHTCETVCRRNKVEQPVAINNLKRFAADYDLATGHPYMPEKQPPKGKKVAVIGSGPAGLSASYYLAVMGYDVTIFEREKKAGGMLRYGIPEYRLPKKILDEEIKLILDLGVKIEYSKELGKDFTIDDLKKQGFSAVFLGLGAQKSMDMRVEGENIEGVESGIGFLHRVAEGEDIPDLNGKTVIVVGGGNTAMDAARTSIRLGAKEVIVLYRRTRKEMPANDYEIEEAEEEGVKFQYLAAPVKVGKEGESLDVECIKMELGEPDASGRRRPIPIEGSNYHIKCDLLIKAIGQRPDLSGVSNEKLISERDRLKADPQTGVTEDPFVFGGGDCVIGAATAVEAIAGGRKAAYSIDQYLTTGKVLPYSFDFIISKGKLEEIPDEYFKVYDEAPRVKMPAVAPSERIHDFREIELGLSEEQALKEAARCLECGCNEGFSCKLRVHSTEYNVSQDDFTGAVNHYSEYGNLTADHPVIIRDQNKCIKCGICVRYCDEIKGLGVFGFVRRGFETEISPSFYHELVDTQCDFCGGCADACPTGALSINPFTPKPGPFKTEKISGYCTECPLHCELEYNVYENTLIRVGAVNTAGENDGSLCVRGRFNYKYLQPENRETRHLIYTPGSSVNPISREEALSKAIEYLKESERPLIVTSTNLLNEEYRLIHEISNRLTNCAVVHIPTDRADSFNSPIPVYGKSAMFEEKLERIEVPSLKELEKTENILLFNIKPARSFSILELKLRKAVKNGNRVFSINEDPLQLDSILTASYRIKSSYYTDFVKLLGKAVLNSTEASGEPAEYFKNSEFDTGLLAKIMIKEQKVASLVKHLVSDESLAIIVDEDTTCTETVEALINLALIVKGSKFLALSRGANPNGAIPYLKNIKTGDSEFALSEDLINSADTIFMYKTSGIKAGSKQRIINFDYKPAETFGYEGVFIPAAGPLEMNGTITHFNNSTIKVSKVLEPPPSVEDTSFLRDLLEKL